MSYRGWTMSWQGGRQLASMTKGNDTISFVYKESGLRTNKTVNGVTHNYVWQGSKLAADITDTYALYFHYDSTGDVIGFTRTANGTDTEYFYVKNLQGDILKVITATGTEAAAYTYDAWGKLLTSSGDMADVNPLRYHGYFYDTETGLYYLKSRYYDPEVCRFINSDGYNSTGQGILSANMFSYCLNNPINYQDSSGATVSIILGAGLGIAAIISTIAAVSAVDTAGLEKLVSDIGYEIANSVRNDIELAKFVGSKIWEGIQKKNERYPGEYTVYFLTDGEDVRYVGRTKDLGRRMNEHNRPGSKTYGLDLYAFVSGLTYSEARGLEQIGIVMYNTINAGKNTINGISNKNPLLPGYIAVAWDFIYNEASNEFFSFVENHLYTKK